MMVIDNRFDIKDEVYIKTDGEQLKRIVTAIQIAGENSITYQLSCGTVESWHYEFELSAEVDLEIKIKS